MDRKPPADAGKIRVEPMNRGEVLFYSRLTTFLGLHRSCRFKVCRRAGACSTRQVLCYQEMEEKLQPIALSVTARRWRNMTERGEKLDVAPIYEVEWPRLLAWEDEEIALIEAGAFGDDDNLTPYQLWLKNFAAIDSRDRAARRKAAGHLDTKPEPTPPDVLALRHPGARLP
jgi:hypothetical protein